MENKLFEVKVFDAKGRLKKIVTPKKLNKRHWDIYNKQTVLYKKGAAMDYIFGQTNLPGTTKNDMEG